MNPTTAPHSAEREAFEEKLREFVAYDPITGVLQWAKKPNRSIRIGAPLGRPNVWGHLTFCFNGRTLMVHRVAWFLHRGEWPAHQIDHINGDKNDNRIANLRDVPQTKNMQNQRRGHVGSASGGLLGAHFTGNSRHNPWESSIKADGRRLYLGSFPTKEAAHVAYMKAKGELHDTGN